MHLTPHEQELGKGNTVSAEALWEQLRGGASGFKLHEDWGTTAAAIDACLTVADASGVQVALHSDTVNEAGYVESTLAAIRGRSIHAFHTEGAGGGHAPDIIKVAPHPDVLPSVVVHEDVDLVAADRSYGHPGSNPLLFEVLNQPDGLGDHVDVVFLLTTNRVEVLERALSQRPGRVDEAVPQGTGWFAYAPHPHIAPPNEAQPMPGLDDA